MERLPDFSISSPYKTASDLIEACKKGDPKAQFQIYKLYSRAMYLISLGIVNDPGTAEDITNESFIDAFEKIGSYTGSACFDDWLARIVQTRSIEKNYGIVPLKKAVRSKYLCRER